MVLLNFIEGFLGGPSLIVIALFRTMTTIVMDSRTESSSRCYNQRCFLQIKEREQ